MDTESQIVEIGPEDAVSSGFGEKAMAGEREAVVVPTIGRRIKLLPSLAPIVAQEDAVLASVLVSGCDRDPICVLPIDGQSR